MTDEYWIKLDRKAISIIRLCLVDYVLFNVAKENTTKSLWEKLGKLYETISETNKFSQKKNFLL